LECWCITIRGVDGGEVKVRLFTVTLLGRVLVLRYECSVCSRGWLRLCKHARTAKRALEVALRDS